jgi:hypothetical protein
MLPVAFNLNISFEAGINHRIAHSLTHAAAVGAVFPLICDYLCDFSLPERLTHPRGMIMVALLVPNSEILLMMNSLSKNISVF